jgi:tetratricopeptide (TPR) repeat protein
LSFCRPDPVFFRQRFWPAVLFLAVFGFYLGALNPTFYADDSPETVTAALTLGIPHPPGYPLYTLAGSLFTHLPLSGPPFKVNLLSVVLSASVCVLLFLFLKGPWKISAPLAGLFSLFWAMGATTYPAALSAKTGVYHLTVLFLLALLWTLLKGKFEAAGFLFGLSLAHHWMSMLAFLPGLFFMAAVLQRRNLDRRRFLTSSAFAFVGFSLYLILPLRSVLSPLLNWGEPSTIGNFFSNFTRHQYQGAEGNANAKIWLYQWGYYLKLAFFEFSLLSLVAAAGILLALKRNAALVLALCLTAAGLVGAVGLYLNLPPERMHLVGLYALPAHLFIILFAAWGVELALQKVREEKRGIAVKIAACLLAVWLLGLGFERTRQARQDGYTCTYDFVLNAMKGVPKDSLFYCKGDSMVFPCWYFQWVEKRRTDLAIVGVDGLPMEWIRKTLQQFHPTLAVPFTLMPVGNESVATLAQWMILKNQAREVYFSYNNDNGQLPGVRFTPYGLSTKRTLLEQPRFLDEAKAQWLWGNMRLRHLKEPGVPLDDYTRQWILKDYGVFRNSLGVFYEELADEANALPKGSDKQRAENFLKARYYYEMCRENFLWAQGWDPSDPQYAFNVGNSLFNLGRKGEAMQWYQKSVDLKGDYVEAFFNYAVAAMDSRQYPKAGELFRKVLKLKPDHPGARQGLDFVMQQGAPGGASSGAAPAR